MRLHRDSRNRSTDGLQMEIVPDEPVLALLHRLEFDNYICGTMDRELGMKSSLRPMLSAP